MKSTKLTIKDIAKALNISASTVSRALNNHPDISKATIKKVQDYAQKHNYIPNTLAMSLRTQKSNIIGVIVPELANHFFSSVLSGMEQEAEDEDYHVIVCQSSESFEKEFGRKADRKRKLFNGDIRVDYYQYFGERPQ